jgi:ribosomal protein L40E
MSEFIAVAGGSGNEYTVSEHTTARVLAGEPEAVRARLAYALESLGYTVVTDNPLQARRARRKDIFRADFDDHPRRVAVGLRKTEAATQVTFDFVVTHGSCVATKGDLLTLEREADALAALARSTPAKGLCRSCGTENGGEARFCRSCGAPNSADAPAELEVLRLTAASRAGLQEIVGGLLIAVAALAGALAMILLSVKPKVVNAGWVILLIGQLFGWWMALYGMRRIHRTLNRKAEARLAPAAADPPPLSGARDAALPAAPFSVTEGTTELLGSAPRERERVRARREHSDTSPIG